MRACSIIVVSKIYMVQLLRQIVSFILRYLTVNHQGLPHYIKKCLPYSNNLHTLLPLFCSLSGNWSTGKYSFLMWKWSVREYEVLHCGWLEETVQRDKGSYLWAPTTMNRMSKFFALVLFNIPFACFPYVSLIFSQQKEKAYDQRKNMENAVKNILLQAILK